MFILKRLRTRNVLFQGVQVLIKERNNAAERKNKKSLRRRVTPERRFFMHLNPPLSLRLVTPLRFSDWIETLTYGLALIHSLLTKEKYQGQI